MEAITIGQMVKPRTSTICWKGRDGSMWEAPVGRGEILMVCDDSVQEVIPGLHSVSVLHPEHGAVTCILEELVPVN